MSSPFPKDFLWGAATSSHQVEGNNHNDWSEWEQEHAEALARTAEQRYRNLPAWPRIKDQATRPENYISGRAADHYHRFREDFDIARELGHNAHRFSIEWSRIEPQEGVWNEAEIEHYRTVLRELRARGLEPFVTLWHWTIPLWLRNKGGVLCPQFGKYFARYARHIVEALGSEATYWMTLNEPGSVIMNSFLVGRWPPGKHGIVNALRAFWRLADAHRRGYRAIHDVNPALQIGVGHIMTYLERASRSPLDFLPVAIQTFVSNRLFLLLTPRTHDYLGLQYYIHLPVSFPFRIRNPHPEVTDFWFDRYQKGLYVLLKRLQRYRLPIFVTENGIADARDMWRASFITEAVSWIGKAREEGVDVRGYFYWSLLDNFEWAEGFWPRFGLVEIDYATLQRTARASAWEYKKLIEENRN